MNKHALEKIAADLRKIAAELEAGHTVDPYDLVIAARRLDVQAEMDRGGLV